MVADVQGSGDVSAVGGDATSIDENRGVGIAETIRGDIQQTIGKIYMVVNDLAFDRTQTLPVNSVLRA